MKTLLGILCLTAAGVVFVGGALFIALLQFLGRGGIPDQGGTIIVFVVCGGACLALVVAGIALIRSGDPKPAPRPKPGGEP